MPNSLSLSPSILDLEELQALRSPNRIVRVPEEIDIAVTPRVLRLIDTHAFRRLAGITQLGLVGLVYPGATHTRFEHSLGVYRNATLFLQRLGSLPDFQRVCSPRDATLLLVGSLLHDIGHWPFCHAIEDMGLPGVPRHEAMARELLRCDELEKCLRVDWDLAMEEVAELLAPVDRNSPKFPLLGSILSGPIDIDKLDYLDRDSLHAGVPYGRNFDRHRLTSQLCLGPDSKSLAITDKARTAAEMMVFARYVTFSEVYWHHAVRSATCMLQRAIWELQPDWLVQRTSLSEGDFVRDLRQATRGTAVEIMTEGLFGIRRCLYKRISEFHRLDNAALHQALARRPYVELVELSQRLAQELARETGLAIQPTDVLIDAPPVKLEVQLNIQVRQSSGDYMALGELSPVANTLANQQFDSLVKRVRVFANPQWREPLKRLSVAQAILRIL